MKKRILIFFASFVLLLSLLTVSAAAADAELRVIAPEKLPAVGEEFTVTVEISGNPGLCAFQATLPYDKSVMECTEVELGPLLEGMLSAGNPYSTSKGGAVIGVASVQKQEMDGIAVVFHFRVLNDNAAAPRALSEIVYSGESGALIPYTLVQCDSSGNAVSLPVGNEIDRPAGGGTDQPAGGGTDQPAGGGTDQPAGGEGPGRPENATAFPDVAGHWGAEFIAKAAELGLFTGFEDGSFRPDGTVTRGQFVTVLWRMAGKPAPTEAAPFTDAQPGAWYADAVAWAHEKGYVNGRTETSFDPDGSITRQEAMKILFAYNGGVSGAESMFTAIYDSDFTDSGEIAAWARPAMYWGYYKGIINGKTATTLCPTDTATRAELAKILVVYSESVNAN